MREFLRSYFSINSTEKNTRDSFVENSSKRASNFCLKETEKFFFDKKYLGKINYKHFEYAKTFCGLGMKKNPNHITLVHILRLRSAFVQGQHYANCFTLLFLNGLEREVGFDFTVVSTTLFQRDSSQDDTLLNDDPQVPEEMFNPIRLEQPTPGYTYNPLVYQDEEVRIVLQNRENQWLPQAGIRFAAQMLSVGLDLL
jgi:hypothetical protein